MGVRWIENMVPAAIEIAIAAIFLGLAAWFLFQSPRASIPSSTPLAASSAEIQTTPLRQPLGDEPKVRVAGFEMKCMECHGLFESRPETARRLTQHTHIVLAHGLNDRCFNCHDNARRDRLALRVGQTIPFSQVARLCAKCHGPTYRDWQAGMHGRTVGFWDRSAGTQNRLSCSECHDPHAPAFPSFRPLPGPRTLRMGEPWDKHEADPVESIDPLRMWQHGREKAHPPVAPEELPPEHSLEGEHGDEAEGAS